MKIYKKTRVNLFLLVSCLCSFFPAGACTIFVLTDAEKTLFFNNEDWSDPSTRIWFQPGGESYFGAAYVGFDNGWAQGGVNTEGLAFDWVAGFEAEWPRENQLKSVRGNPTQRMLESCATVDEAIAFYQKFWEPGFSYARVMIADKTGKSVIISARDGKLVFDIAHESRGFGYGAKALNEGLASRPAPTVGEGIPILQACMQEGQYATKYSSVYDLKTGQISLISFVGDRQEVQLNLFDELDRGPHSYEISKAALQKGENSLALEAAMKRFPADEYQPIPDTHPEITQKIAGILKSAVANGLNAEDFEAGFWKSIEHAREAIQQDMADLGRLQSISRVEGSQATKEGEFLYRIEYEYAIVVQRFGMDERSRIALIVPEVAEPKMK